MAKKNMLAREKKRMKLIVKYKDRRHELKKIIKSSNDFDAITDAQNKLAKLPLNSNPVRFTTRCEQCGRCRAVYKKFNLCRICLRKYGMTGNIAGLRKSSW